ncbi:fasciclin domain-containing protein [Mangrovicoccus ximenensis]|uniref:fasciclin domain-containing protein n=1 Tax=Mangrovicoccus ximenensis TaxID=1911570 RepID=UPI000D34E25A|nr:fasciclin domain-containing protein [Mangrovicoccus ximenensis]
MIRSTILAATATAAFALPAFADAHMGAKTIPETAAAAGEFGTLLAAVEAAGLAETLSGEGPFTVFAPTDAAFAALPEGTVEELLLPENKDKLAQILTYHVLPAAVMSSEISGEMMPETVEGSTLAVMGGDDGVTVDGASVTQADIEASNGVIHVIDAVLMPEG